MRQEKRKSVVIASVLKPVDDTRMFGKIARTLADLDVTVHVIGYASSSAASPDPRIVFHPLPRFKRLSLQRLFARVIVLRKVFSLRPTLFITTTHELLGAGIAVKIYTGAKLIYEVQENYFWNLRFGKTMPRLVGLLVGAVLRLKEIVSSPFVDHFILAERCYADELHFVRKKYTVIENKAVRPSEVVPTRGRSRLLFSGTLAETTGLFNAIKLAERLHAVDRSITLTITGYCSRKDDFIRLMNIIAEKPFISVYGGDQLVAHDKIVDEIMNADFGLILYEPNRATADRIPTKLYEYLAYRLPIIQAGNAVWAGIISKYGAGINIPTDGDIVPILRAMHSEPFYKVEPSGVYWEDETERLRSLVTHFLIK